MARTTLFTLSLLAASAFARTVKYNFNVANGQVAPDGVTRNAVLVNGRFPGPLITANKDDTLEVTVKNKLTDPTMRRSTTIHWHGLLQARNAEEDGPAFVTQCPIAPEESYTYKIPLDGQSGTYWYHSHLSSQYVDGLRGPLVVYDPKDPYRNQYDVDDETTVLTLADWYHTPSEAIMATRLVAATIPDSGTINGKGRYDPLNITATPDNLYTLKVKRGKRYRLRVINAGAIASYRFSVQGHKCTIIEVDGVLTKPVEVDSFDILAGQRYSCILKADQNPDTYWINAPITNVLNTNVQALLVYEDDKRPYHPPWGGFHKWKIADDIVRYWKHTHGHSSKGRKGHKNHKMRMIESGHAHAHKRGLGVVGVAERRHFESEGDEFERRQTTEVVLDESVLAPLERPGSPGGSRPADMVVELNFDLNFANGHWRINNQSYSPPDVPTLLKILTDKHIDSSDFSADEHTIILPRNKVIEFHIFGSSLGIVHPMHLHGHAFDVVQYGNNPPNYKNPPRRDVVGVTDDGVRIRFKTDNPGPWFLHCHIDWHLEEGLAMVFAEAPEAIKSGSQSVKPDSSWKKLCDKYEKLPEELQ